MHYGRESILQRTGGESNTLQAARNGTKPARNWPAVGRPWFVHGHAGDQDFYRLFLGLPNHAANEPCALCRPESDEGFCGVSVCICVCVCIYIYI